MKFLFFLIVFIHPVFNSFSQEFKPIIDPSHACSYGNPNNPLGSKIDFFHVVETMPEPKITFSSIEKILEKRVTTQGIQPGKTMIQLLVNCEGKAGDYQFLTCDPETAQFCREVLDVFQENIDWNPGIQKGRTVDVLLRIEVDIKNGQIHVKRL